MSEKEVSRIFANNLRRLMMIRNLNQKELAHLLGVSESSVSNWMKEINVPRTGVLQKLTQIFDCKPSDLLTDGSARTEELDDDIHNPDIRMIARAGKKMTPEQAEQLRRYAEFMFPEAFKDE